MPAIQAKNLSRTFAQVKRQPGVKGALKGLFSRQRIYIEAVKGIDLNIDQGEIVGFLGPNGAGKTTTIKMLTGILYPTGGEAKVLGYTPFDRKPEMLRQIALVMGNKMQLWWDLPAWDSFVVLAELYDVEKTKFKLRAEHLCEILGISDKVHSQVRKLSLGERMKCELVASLLHSPKVLFLDEPTIGLDVVSQKRIREFLRDMNREDGSTIILTSHYMQDVEELCERVVVIDHGALIYDGTLSALSSSYATTKRLRLTFEREVSASDLAPFGLVIEANQVTATLEIDRRRTSPITAEVLQRFPVTDVAIEEVDIEEVIRDLFSQSPPELDKIP